MKLGLICAEDRERRYTHKEGESLPFDIGKVTDTSPNLARASLLQSHANGYQLARGLGSRKQMQGYLRVRYPRCEP